jgi:hypothetical protein
MGLGDCLDPQINVSKFFIYIAKGQHFNPESNFPVCAETVDCYSGQICQAGRCTFTAGLGGIGAYGGGLGYGGGYGAGLGAYGGGLGLGTGYGLGTAGLGYDGLGAGGVYSPYSSSLLSPYGSFSPLDTLISQRSP